MASNSDENIARSAGLSQLIDRRRFLTLCGGAVATVIVASCTDPNDKPDVDQVILTDNQIPTAGGEPVHSEEGHFYLINNDNELFALHTKCTHQGCTVAWMSAQQGFACPCHGSKFDRHGYRTDGPAKRPLDLMAMRRQPDGSLVIDTGEITKRSG